MNSCCFRQSTKSDIESSLARSRVYRVKARDKDVEEWMILIDLMKCITYIYIYIHGEGCKPRDMSIHKNATPLGIDDMFFSLTPITRIKGCMIFISNWWLQTGLKAPFVKGMMPLG
jgi:hypothetical protein